MSPAEFFKAQRDDAIEQLEVAHAQLAEANARIAALCAHANGINAQRATFAARLSDLKAVAQRAVDQRPRDPALAALASFLGEL